MACRGSGVRIPSGPLKSLVRRTFLPPRSGSRNVLLPFMGHNRWWHAVVSWRPMMNSPAVLGRVSAARLGVAMLFIANALVFASIVTRYPELNDRFDLSELTFGLMVACGPVGSVVGSIVAGRLVARLGAVPVAVTSSADRKS